TGLHASVTLGAGQFCTNPGLVFLPSNSNADEFVDKLNQLMVATPDQTMLTPGIKSSYHEGVTSRGSQTGVATVMQRSGEADCAAGTALFRIDSNTYLANPALSEEIFGPTTLIVSYDNEQQLLALVSSLEGQLTATIHGTESEFTASRELI